LIQGNTREGGRSYVDTRFAVRPLFYWEDSTTLTDAPADQVEIWRLPRAPVGTEIAKVDVVIRLRRV